MYLNAVDVRCHRHCVCLQNALQRMCSIRVRHTVFSVGSPNTDALTSDPWPRWCALHFQWINFGMRFAQTELRVACEFCFFFCADNKQTSSVVHSVSIASLASGLHCSSEHWSFSMWIFGFGITAPLVARFNAFQTSERQKWMRGQHSECKYRRVSTECVCCCDSRVQKSIVFTRLSHMAHHPWLPFTYYLFQFCKVEMKNSLVARCMQTAACVDVTMHLYRTLLAGGISNSVHCVMAVHYLLRFTAHNLILWNDVTFFAHCIRTISSAWDAMSRIIMPAGTIFVWKFQFFTIFGHAFN